MKQDDNVEVHNMDDMKKGHEKQDAGSENKLSNSPAYKVLSVVLMVLALIYDVSPIDLSPDAVPVLGWFDDVGFTLTAGVNLIQQFMTDQQSALVKILRYIKWIMVVLVVIAALLLFGLVAAIVALVTH